MSTNSTRREEITASLQDKEYRDAFAAAEICTTLPFQIRETRKARGWTQKELADRTGQEQPTISKFEDPDYANFSINSLKRLASAFDVALVVRLVPFSELVEWTLGRSQEQLAVSEFAKDQGLRQSTDTAIIDTAAYHFTSTSVIAGRRDVSARAGQGVRFSSASSFPDSPVAMTDQTDIGLPLTA